MKKLFLAALALMALALFSFEALAQTPGAMVNPCVRVSATVCTPLSEAAPLPVNTRYAASGVAPLIQSFTAVGNTAAWVPVAGRPINATITGTATGLSVRLVRSFDGGSTWSPLTVNGQPYAVWTSNVSEQAWVETEAPATPIQYRLEVTEIASGTATVRLSQ